ncbi:hypothetical protein PPERSA_10847 [Pseudocohnilembus persalinus]|uniref:Uncharacterized protein n=1 Tax=Pseudocohnilembus persalinus TaxID=266149 RepID=A0A0V0QDU1_PSEPJ|nr:hypothetical protein PPERSA_10847 [Pseudocohnilembus persalinus]|eukprot:KRX00348.1 hypothetical protein PPERSA_10847 [Pseudocohnilembus persalinus]
MLFSQYVIEIVLQKYEQKIKQDFKLLPQSYDIARYYLQKLFQEMQDFGLQNLVDFFNQKRPKSLRRMRVYDSMNLEQFIDIFKQYFEALSQVETVKHRPDRFKRIENIKISSLSGVNALRNQGIAFTDFNEISQEDGLQDNDLNSIQPSQVPITIPKVNFDIIFLFLGDIFDSKILNDTESIEKHIEAFDSICRFQIYKPKMDHIQEEDIEDDEEQCIIEEEYIEKLKKEIMEKLASSGNKSKLITEKKLDELIFTAEKDETQSEQVESQNILQKGLMKSYRSFGFLDKLNFSNKKQRNREQEESNLEEFESDMNIEESDINSMLRCRRN